MFCVIQKLKNKRKSEGTPKEIIVTTSNWKCENVSVPEYGYRYSSDKFDRDILDAYKISIHKSYRENGKVKKKQWSICTVGYYDLALGNFYDFLKHEKIEQVAEETNSSIDDVYDLIYDKADPIIKQVEAEFRKTDEYKQIKKQLEVLNWYNARKLSFENVYGKNTFDKVYDVFMNLRNPELKELLEQDYKEKRQQEQEEFERQYREYEKQFSSYSVNNYTDDEKEMLKKIYRLCAKTFHPDVSGDDGEMMKFITKLKEQWEI